MKKSFAMFIVSALFLSTNIALAQKPESLPEQAVSHMAVCPNENMQGIAHCHARVVTDGKGNPQTSTLPAGYGPKQFQGAYNTGAVSSSKTIAVVDAYNDPNIKSDLDNYNKVFGLPSFPTCLSVSSTGCFLKVNQTGVVGNYPSTNSGWALEISLDVEIAHAMCPTCRLILVEASSNSVNNLISAINTAAALGADTISNSWGASEWSGETSFDSQLNLPGRAITFSSGDAGFGTEYPAASSKVTAVGGTTLTIDGSNNYVSESAWSGAGSGCSSYEKQPLFQTLLGLSGCSGRIVADVSADANPSTGAAVYDSVRYQGHSGWFKVGGTSLASPIIASVYALAGDLGPADEANSLPYARVDYATNLHDVVSGSNGSCGGSFLCTAIQGFDGPTGLGTPNGLGAF